MPASLRLATGRTTSQTGEGCAAGHQRIGRAAIASLYDELSLEPKPGLVSFINAGSHDDMDARTFMRSLFSLRHYFPATVAAGAEQSAFSTLREMGLQAEQRMLRATAGINTHRGAIFSLGLLCAAAGACLHDAPRFTPALLRKKLIVMWGAALVDHAATCSPASSNGQRAFDALGLTGARQEAAAGFPTVFCVALPALATAREQGLGTRHALLQAFFCAMAEAPDTNLAHRGGLAGLLFAQGQARRFLEAGGAARPDAIEHARSIHRAFIARRLSPGGSADLLAAACFVHRICGGA